MTVIRPVSSLWENTTSRLTVLEKLRRLLFCPKILALPVLAAAFYAGNATAADIPFDPTSDITIGTGDTLTIYNDSSDLKSSNNDSSKMFTLDGGTLNIDLGQNNGFVLGPDQLVIGKSSKDFSYGPNGGTINFSSDQGNDMAIGRTHTTTASLTKTGNGSIILSTSAAGDAHTFGDLTVTSGNVHLWGYDSMAVKTTFEGDVLLTVDNEIFATSAGNLTLYGDTIFNKTVTVEGVGYTKNILSLTSGENIFNGDVKLQNYGAISDYAGVTNTFNGNFEVQGVAYFKGKETFNEDVKIVYEPFYGYKFPSYFYAFENSEINFEKNLDSTGSSLQMWGKANFNGDVEINDGSFLFASDTSDLTFNGNLNVKSSHSVIDKGKTVFNKDISIGGTVVNKTPSYGNMYIYTNTKFNNQGKINVNALGNLYVGADMDYNGTTIEITGYEGEDIGEESVIIDGVVGYASRLKTDINFKNKTASLTYTDLLSKYNVDLQTVEYYDNEIFFTVDELNTPTYLEWDATSKGIREAVTKDQIVTNSLNSEKDGFGNIYIHAYNTKSKEEYVPGQITSTNGYTVVFDDVNKDKLFSQYKGDVNILLGTAVLKGETVFGAENSQNSVFTVKGQSYEKDDELSEKWSKNIYKTNSSGVLAFYRGEDTAANVAPVLNAAVIDLHNGQSMGSGQEEILKGARIWVDTSCNESAAVRQLGTINANLGAIIGDQTKVWYDKISLADASQDMIFTLNTPAVYKNSALSGPLSQEEAKEYVETIFGGAQLVKANYDQSTGNITINARNVADYASDKDMTDAEQEYAAKLDDSRRIKGADADLAFNDALYNETSEQKVKQTIHNLSLLGIVSPQQYSHYGNPTSAFFSGGGLTTASGSSRRGQDANTIDSKPVTDEEEKSALDKKPSDSGPKRTFWASFTHTAVNAYTYDNGGMTMQGYSMHRNGVIGGVKRQVNDTTSCGLFFSFSTPEVKQSGEYDGNIGSYGTEMDMDDFQFAFHLEKVFAQNWEAVFYVGGGTQSMEWDRSVYDNETGFYNYESDSTGNTLTATAYLSRRIEMMDNWALRPTIGIDSEHSWLFGFDEEQKAGADENSNVWMNMFTQQYSYDTIKYSRNTARVGLASAWNSRSGMGGLNGHVFYGVQLGGKDSPYVTLRSDQYVWEDMETHKMGGESINLGLGSFLHLNKAKTISLTGNYNAILYKNAQTQNATGGFQWRF